MHMDITELRRSKLRHLMKLHGTGKLANMLGYSQPSFISQMAGPNPTRELTEKTARRFEQQLNLAPGFFDEPFPMVEEDDVPAPPAPAAQPAPGDTALVAEVIRLVGSISAGEAVTLPPMKFADVVALAYVDAAEHGGKPREDHIKQIVRLLK